MSESALFDEFTRTWRSVRAAFELHRQAAYEAAAEACRDALLNERGQREGIDSYSLFIGSDTRAHAYASPELVEWWATHPRLTYTEFERQMTRNGAHRQ